ncbi:hypothetical protein SODALDRAFT_335422 [Sodiomyces alkalinus F11]|uniref:Uncharacterized protein n=1 Tax=Sodiomyces alkalinus (strain CBS 110278 / VKM F-3762 / F11) TaxID=1314773 RepID=A0A3N2PP90_SODAK|nr:hypothetical protein SODALDRAFT_335422 [Sodiomyces alkalinus F11]ROT36322.1 hypothetical protein SODALDRAFT_335422 [Sodiomyces alkalinus F11]
MKPRTGGIPCPVWRLGSGGVKSRRQQLCRLEQEGRVSESAANQVRIVSEATSAIYDISPEFRKPTGACWGRRMSCRQSLGLFSLTEPLLTLV